MGLLDRLMDTMRLNDDDDEYFDDEEDYEEEKPAKKSRFSRDDDDIDDDDDQDSKPRLFSRSGKSAPARHSMEVTLVKPNSIDDGSLIADYLLAGKAVVLNMEGIHTEVAQRIIDFASGAAYSMNGNLQKISSFIFIVTPESIELSGDFQDLLGGSNLDISGLNIRL